MGKNTLEIAPNTVKFDSLTDLRTELGKNTQDKERLGEFEKTIDEALKDWEEHGVIEFTRDEWESLITHDKLPPIEAQKKLLKEKIWERKEITEGTKEQKKGFMKEIEGTVTEKVNGIKVSAAEKIQTLKEKAEKIKQYSKPWLLFLGIGLSLKLWGYKLGNWFSGLFGKKWEYDSKIQEIEMEKEFLADPEAALKKYGAEAKEKFEAGKDGVREKWKEVMSKIPALAAISAVAVGIYAIARRFLPESVTKNVDPEDGKSILKALKGRKFLKLFGAGGLALLGAGGLFFYFSENPDKLKSLWDMPEDAEGKKSWWKKALWVAGIDDHEGGNHFLSYINGEKIKEKLEQRPLEEWKVWLKDHPLYKNTMWKMEDLGNKLLLMQKENPAAFKATLAAVWLVAWVGFVISASTRAIDIAKTFLISATKSAGKHPIMWAGWLIAWISGLTALAHIQIKEDASVDDIREMVWGVFDYDDFKNDISWMPDLIEAPVDKVADCLRDNGAVLAAFITDFCDKFWEKTGQAARDWLILDTHERIAGKNTEWLEAFMQDLKTNKIENIEKLCGEDKKSGVIGWMISKLKKDEKFTEKDIHSLMKATEWTKIRIFPEWWNKDEGRFIQFVTLDENNQPIGMAKNICLNPALSESSQEEASRDFKYNPYDTNTAMEALWNIWEWGRNLVSDLTAAMTAWENEKSKSLADKIMQSGWVLLQAGGNLLLQYGKAIVLLPRMAIEQLIPGGKEYDCQEALVEYAGGMLPIFAVGLGKKALIGGTWWKVLCDTVRLPYDSTKVWYKIFKRAIKWDLAGILRDPAVSINDRFFGRLKSKVPFAENIRMKGKLQRVRWILEKQKWYKDMDMEKTSWYKALDQELSSIVDGTAQGKLRDLIWIKHSNDLSKAKNSIADIDAAIDGINKKLSPEEMLKLREETTKAAERWELTPSNNDLDTLQKQREDLDTQKRSMDNERTKLEEEVLEWEKKWKDISKQKKRLSEMNTSHNEIFAEHAKVRENIEALARWERAPHVINTGKIWKMKMRWKGILGVAAVLWAGVVIAKGIDAIKWDSKSYRDKSAKEILDEWNPAEDGIDYFGYGENEWTKEVTIISEYHCESPKDFEKKLDAISASYSEDLWTFFTQVEEWSPATPETINKVCDAHEKKIWEVKKLLGNNKNMMTAFWKDKFTSPDTGEEIIPDDLRKGGFKAFMFIHKNAEWKFLLDTMNKQDLKNVLTQIYDASDKQDFLKKNLGSTAGTVTDIGLRVAPFTWSAMSGIDAVKDFQHGNISSGLWNVGWCVWWFALDIAGVVSFGGTTALGTGLRVVKAWAVTAVHTGILLTGQWVQHYFDNARSESIEIDNLSEDIK